MVRSYAVQLGLFPHPRVRNVIAIASGKGGVGKSTTAVNLALALQFMGARTGVLDADVYGPSIPTLLGLVGRPETTPQRKLIPMQAFGLDVMSMGVLVESDTPMIWRGPMATSALMQLFNETLWSDLDYLLVDLPPGTGDIQLTLAQKIPVAGAVIVTTPQDLATLDAQKALRMLQKVDVCVIGIVENMALHVCSRCGHQDHLFGQGGGEHLANTFHVPLLGALPLDRAIRQQGDEGVPVVHAQPHSAVAADYHAVARSLVQHLERRPRASIELKTS